MSDDLVNGDTFEVALPVWTVIDGERYKANGLLASIVPMTSPDVGRFIPLCTDLDLAKQFIEAFVPASGKVPVRLLKRKAIVEILQALEKAEWSHVGIDVSQIGGRILGRFYQIRHVIEEWSSQSARETAD